MRYLRARSRLWLSNSTLILRLKRQEPADKLVALDAFGRQGKIQIGVDRWGQGAQVLFLGFGAAACDYGRGGRAAAAVPAD